MQSEMTEAQKRAEFKRRMKFTNTATEPVACLWCGQVNMPDGNVCCASFEAALDEYTQGQFDQFLKAYERVKQGKSLSIACPWCGEANWIPQANPTQDGPRTPLDWKRPNVSPFCCDMFVNAAMAVAQRLAWNQKIDAFHRIQDAMAKAERN